MLPKKVVRKMEKVKKKLTWFLTDSINCWKCRKKNCMFFDESTSSSENIVVWTFNGKQIFITFQWYNNKNSKLEDKRTAPNRTDEIIFLYPVEFDVGLSYRWSRIYFERNSVQQRQNDWSSIDKKSFLSLHQNILYTQYFIS